MRIYITHVFVDDQEKAQRFSTDVLGFQTKANERTRPTFTSVP